MTSFFGELRRRNVVKVAVAYAIVGWLLIEVSTTVLPVFEAPDWIAQVFTFFVILGFPLALILSWAYEITPEGIKLERNVAAGESITHVTGRKLDFIIIGVLAIAVAVFAIERFVLVEEPPTPLISTDDRRSIAVLPLDNLSPDPENAFFADGIHGDLLTQLSKISSLKVISRTSVMEYRDSPKNMREIGQELGVATILEGDVRRAGDTVRINVQLIDAETDEHLWAETYDRELTAENVFAIQSEIAISIAGSLQVTLLPEEVARLNEVPTQNRRAYDFYLTGNDYIRRANNMTSWQLAAQQYQRAVDEDPRFALAWAALGLAHTRLYTFGVDRTESRLGLSLDAIETAFELAPDLPEAHYSMGRYHATAGDYDSALEEYTSAERGMVGDARLFAARGDIYFELGQWEEAVASSLRAIELDPRNSAEIYSLAATYLNLGDYENGERYLDRTLTIAPDYTVAYLRKVFIPLYRDGDTTLVKAAAEDPPIALGLRQQLAGWTAAFYERDYDTALDYLDDLGEEVDAIIQYNAYIPKATLYGVTYQFSGDPDMAEPQFQVARVQLEEALVTASEDPRIYSALGEVLAYLGEPESAVRMAREGMEQSNTWTGPAYQLYAVRIFAAAGDTDAAIEELDAYLSVPNFWSIEGLLLDPRLDPIRDDTRFQALVEKYRRQ